MGVRYLVLLQVASRLLENQPRWGCLQDRALGLATGPWAPDAEVDEDVLRDPSPRIIRPEERNVRLWSDMDYLSRQNWR